MKILEVEKITKVSKKPFKLANKVDVNLINIQKKIEETLGLKVNIVNKKNNSGKVIVEYKNLEQFELLSKLLRGN